VAQRPLAEYDWLCGVGTLEGTTQAAAQTTEVAS
jgi:hypothetical protein